MLLNHCRSAETDRDSKIALKTLCKCCCNRGVIFKGFFVTEVTQERINDFLFSLGTIEIRNIQLLFLESTFRFIGKRLILSFLFPFVIWWREQQRRKDFLAKAFTLLGKTGLYFALYNILSLSIHFIFSSYSDPYIYVSSISREIWKMSFACFFAALFHSFFLSSYLMPRSAHLNAYLLRCLPSSSSAINLSCDNKA